MSIISSVLRKDKSFGSRYGAQRIASGVAINAGATQVFDLDVSGMDNLTILASLTATALTDLVLSVVPFDTAGVVHLQALSPAVAPQAQVLSAGHALAAVQYDMRGIDTIEVQVKNANAGAQTITFVDIFAAVTGAEIL